MSTASIPQGTTVPVAEQLGDRESRFLIHCLDWNGYEQLLSIFSDAGPRISYLDGEAELMSPGPIHEQFSYILGRMVSDLLVELRIPANGYGSTTFRRRSAKVGLEPDECFYLTNRQALHGQTKTDLDAMPPSDLVIEIEITSALLPKLAIYAGMRVPEIWRYDGSVVTILLLQPDGSYLAADQSRALPFLPLGEFGQQLAAYDPSFETDWFIAYRRWVREVVLPLHQP